MDEMRSKVECPVCLVVPRAGPVPQCLRGHFLCSGCKERRGREGRQDCPSCRGPMGEAQSLLALVVIENVKHKCEHKNCDEMIHYKELEGHKDSCQQRLVLGPGSGMTCSKLVPFLEVAAHVNTCSDNSEGKNGEAKIIALPEIEEKRSSWSTWVLEFDGKMFFFRMRKLNNLCSMEVVLLGTQIETEKYYAEISVFNPKAKFKSTKSCFEPRPISQDEWGIGCFTVTESVLAKLWSYNAEERR